MIKVGLLTEIIAPYRVPVFNCLAVIPGIELEVIFLSETEDRRAWEIPKEAIHFKYTVLSGCVIGKSVQDAPLFLNLGTIQYLRRSNYDVIICGGYQHPSYWLAFIYAQLANKSLLLWTESTRLDTRSHNNVKEMFKRFLIRRCRGFIVPGTSQKEYLLDFDVVLGKIWTAPNAIDVEVFSDAARCHRGNKEALKCEMGIAGPIILFVGRILHAKGIAVLLSAFEIVQRQVDATLVIVGDGPDKTEYESHSAAIGSNVRFVGFQQQNSLPKYYAIADVFVLPTYSDPWGLVINEAMASGLPIVSSTAAGAAKDLVHHGKNGYVFDPGDVEGLAKHIGWLLTHLAEAQSMGKISAEMIKGYTPEKCGDGFAAAIFHIHEEYARH